MYAHLDSEPTRPGELALQYWFFYVYNDFNAKHEGDWEMIQLDFHARDASSALAAGPSEVGYSQHEGAEQAPWRRGGKLELVDGTHPVVYPALGSHANYFAPQLYLGSSASQGVGCDDTRGPARDVRPAVVVIPQRRTDYLRADPWLGFDGHWGERHLAFNDGPRGPATTARWAAPLTWAARSWRPASYAVPDGNLFGHTATGFFCSAVAGGSALLNAALAHPAHVLLALLVVLALAAWGAARTRWRPATPFRLWRRRRWGILVTSAWRLYATNLRLFAGLGLVFVPLGLLAVLVQYLLFEVGPLSVLGDVAGPTAPVIALPAQLVGGLTTLLGLVFVQAATAYAIDELDRDRPVTAAGAARHVLSGGRHLLTALMIAVVTLGLLGLTGVGAVLGLYLAVRWSLVAPAAVLGDREHPLRESVRVTRGWFWRTASVTVFVTVLGLLVGPLVGTALLFATSASFTVVNLVSALVDVVVAPFVAITTTYLFVDLDVRHKLGEPADTDRAPLPAEV